MYRVHEDDQRSQAARRPESGRKRGFPRSALLWALFTALTFPGCGGGDPRFDPQRGEGTRQDFAVEIPDPVLEQRLKQTLGMVNADGTPCTEALMASDLERIQYLYVGYSDELANLEGLQHCTNLIGLSIRSAPVSSLSPISSLPRVERIVLEDTHVSDLSPLAGLGTLERLKLSGNPVSDYATLGRLKGLVTLDLQGSSIEDLGPLSGLASLESLVLDDTPVSDISPLSALSGLKRLFMVNTRVGDFSPLAELRNLVTLELSGAGFADCSVLQQMVGLRSLDLRENLVEDIEPLRALSVLTDLRLADNRIADVSALAVLPELEGTLDLSNNRISDIAPIVDLAGRASLDAVYLDGNPLDPESCSTLLQALENSVTYVIAPCENVRHGKVLVVVNRRLEPAVRESLNQYALDLSAEGYEAEVVLFDQGTADDLRDLLRERYRTDDLVGAVLVGDIPEKMVLPEDLSNRGAPFPCDYYFMDLDGEWTDSYEASIGQEPDGFVDSHWPGEGDLGPEIWVGRLPAHMLVAEDEAELVNNYFRKNHAYRTGALALRQRAMVYIDDDWHDSYPRDEVRLPYAEIDMVTEPSVTTAPHYRSVLDDGYEFVHLRTHTSPWGHAFKNPEVSLPGSLARFSGGLVLFPEIKALDPAVHFFVLDACFSGTSTAPGFIGGQYLFSESHTLVVLAMSTSASGLHPTSSFYDDLDRGGSFGAALQNWYTRQVVGSCPDWNDDEADGGYCAVFRLAGKYETLLGDPTLLIQGGNVPFHRAER